MVLAELYFDIFIYKYCKPVQIDQKRNIIMQILFLKHNEAIAALVKFEMILSTSRQ